MADVNWDKTAEIAPIDIRKNGFWPGLKIYITGGTIVA